MSTYFGISKTIPKGIVDGPNSFGIASIYYNVNLYVNIMNPDLYVAACDSANDPQSRLFELTHDMQRSDGRPRTCIHAGEPIAAHICRYIRGNRHQFIMHLQHGKVVCGESDVCDTPALGLDADPIPEKSEARIAYVANDNVFTVTVRGETHVYTLATYCNYNSTYYKMLLLDARKPGRPRALFWVADKLSTQVIDQDNKPILNLSHHLWDVEYHDGAIYSLENIEPEGVIRDDIADWLAA